MESMTEVAPPIPPRSPRVGDLPHLPDRPSIAKSTAPMLKSQEELHQQCVKEVYESEKDYVHFMESIIDVRSLSDSIHIINVSLVVVRINRFIYRCSLFLSEH